MPLVLNVHAITPLAEYKQYKLRSSEPTNRNVPSRDRAGEDLTLLLTARLHNSDPPALKAYILKLSLPTYTAPSGPTTTDDSNWFEVV